MATLEGIGGQKVPVAITLHIEAGNRPNGILKLSNENGKEILIHLDYQELFMMARGIGSDNRFFLDPGKWTKADREQYTEQMDEFMKGLK